MLVAAVAHGDGDVAVKAFAAGALDGRALEPALKLGVRPCAASQSSAGLTSCVRASMPSFAETGARDGFSTGQTSWQISQPKT